MHILTVAPVSRGALQGSLTYFSKDPVAVGMVVVVPVRTREVPAIVLESREASDAKTSLKSSDYAIRKITRAKPRRIWLPVFLKAVEETANFSAQKLGEVLLALTPKTILDAHLEGFLPELIVPETNSRFEILGIQNSTEMRYDAYQRLVRESFVRHESVFICVPTEEDVLRVSKALGRGIEEYTFALHSSMTKKRVLDVWKSVIDKKHAVLVVGTAQYLAVPRYFKTLVIDEEQSPAWRTMFSPMLDLRVFVENYAKACGSKLIIGASILRAETHTRTRRDTDQYDRISGSARKEINTLLVDPRKEEAESRTKTGKRKFVLMTSVLRELIHVAMKQNERIFILSARKGLSPITICDDCGTILRCPECENPLVIHNKEAKGIKFHVFVCHGCGLTRVPENNVNETCPHCHGWKLSGMGIGIDRVSNEISHFFPNAKQFLLDGNRVKTRAGAKKLIEQFEKSTNGILIATPMAVPLIGSVPLTAIISIDSLFAIPDIRMPERIFALILALREKTTRTSLIQTRSDDTTIFRQALSGELRQFTENELSLRKTFSYPPYGTIIKITVRGKRSALPVEIENLKNFLLTYSPIMPTTIARESGIMFRMHMILKLPEEGWPNEDLLAKLRALPPHMTVEINPDNLL
ncbi:MAG: hypothetical protein Q7K40_03390 [bacterium]|nr:hypothetical protein [bacterium]